MRFTDKVVIVTGASSGIGAATAEVFAAEGARVVMVARNQHKLSDVAARCQQAGKEPLIINADISNDNDVITIIQKTINKYGKIDILVNNAGIGKNASLLEGNFIEAYDTVMQTNLRGTIHLTSLAVPYLVKTKGNIINISSAASMAIHDYRFTPYSISKAGMDHFTRGAALELAPSGVRVNSVNPGPVRTNILNQAGLDITWDNYAGMTALGRVSEAEEIGELILFLASDNAKSITGSTYLIDNGLLLK